MKILFAFVLAFSSLTVAAAQSTTPAAVHTDQRGDKASPASMDELTIPSHGSNLNGLIYVAEGAAPHPVVILLHGFPGYEQNLDLAQSLRRAGWNVVFFHYRGSWGSQGDFSFANSQDDVDSAIEWVRNPQNASKYHMNPQRIVLIGHSMGGFMAASGATRDPKIAALVMISAWNIGNAARTDKTLARFKERSVSEMGPRHGCTPDTLTSEIKANREKLDFDNFAPSLKTRPVLVITSNDGLRGADDAFVEALKKAGSAKVSSLHMETDHPYSDHRIALQTAIIEWMGRL